MKGKTQGGVSVLRRTKTDVLKENAATATDFASSLAKDRKFRKELISAITHGTVARRRAARKIGFPAAIGRLTSDPKLKRELNKVVKSLEKAWARVEKKRSHKLRNTLLVVARAGGAVAAALPLRKRGTGTTPRPIEESVDVNVPGSA